MKKIFLTICTALVLSISVHISSNANDNKCVEVTNFEDKLANVTDTQTKYATTVVNIRKEPNTNCEILGQTLVNTSVDVLMTIDGWSMIVGEDGYGYIKDDYLSFEPVRYTEEDLNTMAHLLAGECHSLPDDEQMYVGSVVLNRVKSDEFPNTIEEVVFQEGQYACVKDGNYYRKPTDSNWENARRLLENDSVLPDDVLFQSTCEQSVEVYLKTKYHYYCR